jgi:hypothetical protein
MKRSETALRMPCGRRRVEEGSTSIEKATPAGLRLEKEIKAINGRLEALHEQKRRIIDIYASGDLSRDGYVEKNRE